MKKIYATVLALLLGVCVIGGLELWGEGKEKPSNWGKSSEEIAGENAGMVLPDSVETETISLLTAEIPIEKYTDYGMDPAAVESAVTIRATVKPDTTTYPALKWWLQFKNAQSEWAKGKDPEDYILLTVLDGDAPQVTVACKQAFGEQILVCAQVESKPDVMAECTVDYVKRPTVSLGQNRMIGPSPTFFSTINAAFNQFTNYNVKVEYGVGTVNGSFEFDPLTLKINSQNIDRIRTQYLTELSEEAAGYEIVGYTAVENMNLSGSFNLTDPVEIFMDEAHRSVQDLAAKFRTGFTVVMNNTSFGDGTASASYTYSYNGKTYGSGEITCDVNFLTDPYIVEADSLMFDSYTVIF